MIPGAFSGDFGSKSSGTEIFLKFISKISVHLSRLSFFLVIWKFRKFPVPFGISTRYESAPVPLAVKSYKMAPSLSSQHYTECKMICHSSSLFLVDKEIVRIRFPGKYLHWSFRISCGQFARFAYSLPREKFVSFSHKYQRSVNSECVLNFST